jgi:hypothetical protein
MGLAKEEKEIYELLAYDENNLGDEQSASMQ